MSTPRDRAHHLLDEHRAGRLSRRQVLARGCVFGLSLTGLGALLAGCAGSDGAPGVAGGSAAARRGGTLRLGDTAPRSAPEPVTMYSPAQINVVQQVAEYLVWVNDDGTLRGVLADRWTPSADAKTWTFTLKQGVRFNTGQPLTAADVVATFDRLTDPAQRSAALSNFRGVLAKGGTVARDERTVEFHLDRAYADFPYLVGSTNYNAVILPAGYAGDFVRKPVGTGPFLLESYLPGQKATFTRNPRYHVPDRPYLDRVETTFFANPQAQTQALLGGTVDALAFVTYLGNQPLFSAKSVTIAATRTSGSYTLQLRVDRAPFTDKRVRQAVAYAVNRKELLAGVDHGYGTLANDHVFGPTFPQKVSLPQREQDIARARQLLADAGLPGGLSATLTTQHGFAANAQLIQQQVKAAGINLALNLVSADAYYGSGSNQPWLQVPVGITDWASRGTAAQFLDVAFVANGVWNTAHWNHPEFTRLVQQFEATVDEQSRNKLAQQIAAIQYAETPHTIPTWADALVASTAKVRGFTTTATHFVPLVDVWLQG